MREFHGQGIELIDIPQSKMSGKNSADIRMVVDALDLCYSKQHIDVFALISGDSDFSPLVSKLKENNKRVLGCGVKSSTSDLLIANCDEFIYYDDLIRVAKKTQAKRTSRAKDGKPSEARTPRRTTRSRRRSTGCWKCSTRSSRITIPSGVRCSSKPFAACFPASTKAITATAAFRICWKTSRAKGLIDLEYDESRGNYKVRRTKE